VDCVVARGGVAPTPVPAWTDGASASAPAVKGLFADTLQRLSGDAGSSAGVSPMPSGAPRKTHAKHADESSDSSADDSADDDGTQAGYTEICQVSWQPICVFPQPALSAVEESALSQFGGPSLSGVEGHDPSPDEGPFPIDVRSALAGPPLESHPGVPADGVPAAVALQTLTDTPAVPGASPVKAADANALASQSSRFLDLPQVDPQRAADATSLAALALTRVRSQHTGAERSSADASGSDTSQQIAPGAARSLARTLEAMNVTKPVDGGQSTATPHGPGIEGQPANANDAAPQKANADTRTSLSVDVAAPRIGSAKSDGGGQNGKQSQDRGDAQTAAEVHLKADATENLAAARSSRAEFRVKPDTMETFTNAHSSQVLRAAASATSATVASAIDHGLVAPPTQGPDLAPTATQHVDAPRAVPQDSEVIPQIVKAMRTQVRDGIGEAQIRLKPEHLGEVRIELKVDGDRVSAVLHVERPEVRQAIESQSQALRSGLAAQGLKLDDLQVKPGESARYDRQDDEPRRNHQQDQESGRQARRKRPDRQFELDAE
jgi:flagellar hook-length control protein FliK